MINWIIYGFGTVCFAGAVYARTGELTGPLIVCGIAAGLALLARYILWMDEARMWADEHRADDL